MSTMSQAATRPAMSLTSGGFSRRVGTWFGTWVYVLVDHLHRELVIGQREIGIPQEITLGELALGAAAHGDESVFAWDLGEILRQRR